MSRTVSLLSLTMVLTAGVIAAPSAVAAPAAAVAPDATIARFRCVTKENEDLAGPGGGPGGSHWNPEDVRCDVTLAWAPAAEGARLDLHYGQGKTPPLVARRHVAPVDEAAPFDTAPDGARGVDHAFFVPMRVVEAAAKRSRKDRSSGAAVYPVRFVLVVTSAAPRGAEKPAVRSIECAVSFGE